jgi:predicted nucleotidyltransferase
MQTETLLKLLKENRVKYVIIGATAFPVHGYSRATLDTDIFIKPDKQNAKKVLKALKEFGYDITEITEEDILTKKVLIRQYLIETDIHPVVTGITFEKVWKNKVKAKFGNTYAWFASLDDLIIMKKAASRSKDIEDLKYLNILKKKRKKR